MSKERGSHEGENLRDRVRGCKSLTLVPLVLSLVNSSNVIAQNSEPEKCYPTNSTVGSLLSWSKMNDITEAHYTKYSFYKLTATAFAVAVCL